MKFGPYLTRLIARLSLLRALMALTSQLAAIPIEKGPGIGNNDNPEELLNTIYENHLPILNIEPTGFQALEHHFNGLSFHVRLEGFIRTAEEYKNLRLRLSGVVSIEQSDEPIILKK